MRKSSFFIIIFLFISGYDFSCFANHNSHQVVQDRDTFKDILATAVPFGIAIPLIKEFSPLIKSSGVKVVKFVSASGSKFFKETKHIGKQVYKLARDPVSLFRRKKSRVKKGHRQPITVIRIEEI